MPPFLGVLIALAILALFLIVSLKLVEKQGEKEKIRKIRRDRIERQEIKVPVNRKLMIEIDKKKENLKKQKETEERWVEMYEERKKEKERLLRNLREQIETAGQREIGILLEQQFEEEEKALKSLNKSIEYFREDFREALRKYARVKRLEKLLRR